MNFIDFHCHLDFDNFKGNWKQIIDDCFSSGFSKIVTVADPYEEQSQEKTLEIIAYHPDLFCVSAVHPHNADRYNAVIEKRLLDFIQNDRVVAIGETGLDFFYDHSASENQKAVFKRQIQIARDAKLPLIIHSRQAEKEVLEILDRERFELPVVFHCYTGDADSAKEIISRGYYISVSGIVTFKKAQTLRDIVIDLPLEQIFTETDSPFLAPEPYRGKENSPLRVTIVADKVAELKQISITQLNDALNRNFSKLF